ncbi:MAG: alkaline phosphatase family protein [Candidatus Daviesbacteria bacterium]
MENFVYPKYKGESLLNVPSTILSLFKSQPLHETLPKEYYANVEGVEKVVLFIADGLGFNLFEKEALKYPFFQKLVRKGLYHKLTSVFPASTAPALNTIYSGLSPLEHGLIEWYMYFKELDSIVESLPFTVVLGKKQEELAKAPKNILFSGKNIFQQLEEKDVSSFFFCDRSYINSFYNEKTALGSNKCGYRTMANFMVSLRKHLMETKGKAYFSAYWPDPDGTEHNFGPDSEEVTAEISQISYMLDKEFIEKVDSKTAEKTAFFLVADHGQVGNDPQNTFYLNNIEGFEENLKISPKGNLILPWGYLRDCYLNVKEERLEKLKNLLEDKIGNIAKIMTIEEALKQQLFGSGEMHPKFLDRVGNLIILPFENNLVYYRYKPESTSHLKGFHGGLSSDEMFIPFISARLSDLKD